MPLRASENIVQLAVEFHHGSLLGLGGALSGRVHGKYGTPLPGVNHYPNTLIWNQPAGGYWG